MDYLNILATIVIAFFTDPRVLALFGLIFLDVVLGMAVALRSGVWECKKVANFYRANVLPYILGYLAFYVAIKLAIPGSDLLGEWAPLVGEGTLLLAWGAILASLGGSIMVHVRALGLEVLEGYAPTETKPGDPRDDATTRLI